MVAYVERGFRRPGVDMVHAIEALSISARESDGTVWPEGPFATEEWVSTSAPATHDTVEEIEPATSDRSSEDIDAEALDGAA